MAAGLENCPHIVIDSIIGFLGLDDIRSLRLTCRDVAANCSSSLHFQGYFRTKHLELKKTDMEAFAALAATPGLPHLVQELRLIGPSYDDLDSKKDTAVKQQSTETGIRLLNQAFDGLARNIAGGRLQILSLAIRTSPNAPPHRRQWQRWQHASDTLYTSLTALSKSKLLVENLQLFDRSHQLSYALATDQLNRVNWDSLTTSFASLRSLSIHLSNRIYSPFEEVKELFKDPNDTLDSESSEDELAEADEVNEWQTREHERYRSDILAKNTEEANFTGFSKFFQMLTELEVFELHYVRVQSQAQLPSFFAYNHERLLERVTELSSLPALKICRLRGVAARRDDLLAFIKRSGARSLQLENVFLVSGHWKPILDYCTSESATITKFQLSALFEVGSNGVYQMIQFEGSNQTNLSQDTNTGVSETLQREGDDLKLPITVHYPPHMLAITSSVRSWMSAMRREFGPW